MPTIDAPARFQRKAGAGRIFLSKLRRCTKNTIKEPDSSWRASRAWLIAALVVTTFAINANTLYNGFILDDEFQVQRNPWIHDWSSIPRMFSGNAWSFAGAGASSNYYRPLMHVIYLLTNKTLGVHPWGFHLVNVLFHGINTLLIFLIASRIFPAHFSGNEGHPGLAADLLSVPFLSAMLFATHPAHSEVVAWIASIPELSFTAFCLGSLALYIKPLPFSRAAMVLCVALYGMALLSKETAIVFPVLIIAYDFALRPEENWLERVKRWIPFILVTAVYVMVRSYAMAGRALPALPFETLGPARFIAYLLPLFTAYVGTLLAPVHLHFWHVLAPLSSFASWEGLFDLAVAALFATTVVIAWKRDRQAFFCLALFVLPLVPAFHFTAIAGKPFAERYLYLPSAGFVILVARLLSKFIAKPALKFITVAVIGVILSLCAVGTISRNRVWKDFASLYADNICKSPEAPVPCNDLARVLFEQNRVDEAIRVFEQQVSQNPANTVCQSTLGSALLLKGRVDEAIAHLEIAISQDPANIDSRNDLGVALRRAGRNQDAIAQYRKALEINPDYPDAHFNLGAVLADTGAAAEALEQYRAAVRWRPSDAYYHNALGIECAKQGLLEEAIGEFEKAIHLAPDEPAYRRNLEHARSIKNSK